MHRSFHYTTKLSSIDGAKLLRLEPVPSLVYRVSKCVLESMGEGPMIDCYHYASFRKYSRMQATMDRQILLGFSEIHHIH